MDMENKVRQIRELVEAKREKFARVSDEVWAVPELYFHETKSAAILIKALKEEGFEVQEGVDGIPTAFIGTWGSGKPVIGILGEFDALPSLSQEAGCWEHKEIVKGGPGHGCGHNALGAGAMAARCCRQGLHGKERPERYHPVLWLSGRGSRLGQDVPGPGRLL